jgi:hypothetical protein
MAALVMADKKEVVGSIIQILIKLELLAAGN